MIPGFALRRSVELLAEHTADHAADEAPGACGIATPVRTAGRRAASAATTAGAATGGTSFIVARICGRRGCHDFGEQGLVLQPVEIAALRIAARRLPARDHDAGRLVELAGDLGIETKAVQPALHVTALTLVEANLILGDLGGFLGKRRGVDAGGQIARR